jgi:DNA modification methylase
VSGGAATVLRGDARNLPLGDDTVDLIVTSPPYWALRSYTDAGEHYDGQIGSEPTPAAYIDNLIDCTREWMRVLKPSGSIWVNLGDKYSGAGRGNNVSKRLNNTVEMMAGRLRGSNARQHVGTETAPPKSLIGLPWRYAIRCIDDLELILRAEIIWNKPNGLPESVTDRVRRSHETWFHLVKSPRYFSAVDAIREEQKYVDHPQIGKDARGQKWIDTPGGLPGEVAHRGRPAVRQVNPLGKLPGSVWEIATQPLKVPAELGVDHFAAFPMEWPRRIIQGWSPSGICTACGEGRRPVVDSVGLDMTRPQARRAHQLATEGGLTEAHYAALLSVGVSDTGRGAATQTGTGKNTPEVYALAAEARSVLGGYAREYLLRRPTGFREMCGCPDTSAPTRPAVVLDPFGGTGTTALVASAHGRHGISVDHSADYCRLARWRIADSGQVASAMCVEKPVVQLDGQQDLLSLLGGAT